MSGDLGIVLDPASIAIIGASDNPHKIGGRPVDYLRRFGFSGQVFPINPNRPEIQGHRSFPSLEALPTAPDVAIIAVPGEAAVAAVDQCAAAGVKVAIMMASGFGETEHGKAQEREMAAGARARNLRLVGPNSQGLANFATGAVASFSSMYLEVPPQDGPVAILSQSGAMSVVPYGILRGRGIGIRHSHATGNDCDVTAAELAAVVAADPEVRVLLLYLESIAETQHLAEVARIAHARNLPILALKPGRTPAGQAAARSHTGALANEDRVVDAFLRRHGIRRVADTAEMVDAVELYLKGWKPQGRRLVVISNSGATCVMAADAASAVGMPMARLSDETQAGLRAVLPTFAATTNPVDITAALLSNSRLFSEILPVIARDPAADAFMIGVPVAGAAYDVPVFARDAAAFAASTGKPLVIAAPQPGVAGAFAATGLPVYPYETQAIAALSGFIAHAELVSAAMARPPVAMASPVSSGTHRLLNEADSLRRLADAGVPVMAHRLCQSEDEAVAALAVLGGAVVLKGCSADIVHKSEHDLVRLGLTDADAVREAFTDCRRIVLEAGLRFDGVLVAPMLRGRREMLLGAHRDAVFGPVVLLGDGGKYVEAMPDTVLLLPPLDAGEVLAAIGGLRIAPVLGGVRGEAAMDVDALAAAAVAVGRLMVEDPSIVSLDVNPLLLGSAGAGVIALDAVVIQSE
ncbi:MAG: acetate--CoA ligase family protein [Janthinobacterium lividum]